MDNKNLIIAVILSVGILAGFQYLYVKPQQEHYRQQVLAEKHAQQVKPDNTPETAPARMRDAVIAESQRIKIMTPELQGSVDLKGASLDDLSLVNYRESIDARRARNHAAVAGGIGRAASGLLRRIQLALG